MLTLVQCGREPIRIIESNSREGRGKISGLSFGLNTLMQCLKCFYLRSLVSVKSVYIYLVKDLKGVLHSTSRAKK